MDSLQSICCTQSSNQGEPDSLQAQAHQSSSSSSTYRWSYDVFLSFRGKDTRKNFTDHLYTALVRAGIRTFRDDDKLERGKEVGPSLLKAIEETRISIPVFSRNYASSKWCLDELVKIVECRDTIGQTILPIFFDVDPSDVRNQTGRFAEAFAQHTECFSGEMVEKWRKALQIAGKLSGWNLEEVANGHESRLILLVVKRVLSELNNTPINIAKHPVGIDSHVEKMMGLLHVESKDVLFVGICGMGGLGKTTIAKAILNQISSGFQGVSFLADIREASLQKGLATLQKQLLENILYNGNENINNVDRGKMLIKERLQSKKVLVILDNVNDTKQLDALAGETNWFGPGSRIIITTRDEHLLNKVDSIYKPEELDFLQSLELFCKHTFGSDQPPKDYRELSEKMVRNVGGLPLVLEIVGSFLLDKKTSKEWENTLDKLKIIPPKEVLEILKISYEELDDLEKAIFLDIACFFIGEDKDVVISILDGCNFHSGIGITDLVHKSLVKIGDNNELRMHDHIRDMGRAIVRQENHSEPGMRSRLWMHEEALGLLKKQMGQETIKVEGLHVNFEGEDIDLKEAVLSTKAFSTMPKLRLLRVNHACIEGDFEHLPKGLRWLSWQGCCLEYIPTIFHLQELVVLDLSWSHVTEVFNCLHQNKVLKKLKVLYLRHCSSLIKTPNFSGLPNLERVILEGCVNLVKIDESIWHLRRLIFLNLEHCSKLEELTSAETPMKDLEALKELNLRGCTSIKILPDLTNLKSLDKLWLTNCWKLAEIQGLEDLEPLKELDLRGCASIKGLPDLSNLKTLKKLWLKDCGKLAEIKGLEGFEALDELDLRECTSIERLPDLSNLKKLQKLWLMNCGKLVTIQGLEDLEALDELDLRGCASIERLPDLSNLKILKKLFLANCGKLTKIQGLKDLEALDELDFRGCASIERLADLANLKKLKKLWLTNCGKLVKIHGLEDLEALDELDLRGCASIERLPDLSNLKKLNKLWLTNCGKLTEIHGLEDLEALDELDLRGCASIERLTYLANLKKLKKLWLTNCGKLVEIHGLEDLDALDELDLRECASIERLPELSNLKKLNKLWLTNCGKLTNIHGLEDLEALDELDLRGCVSIERLPDLSNLKSLKKLWLTNCGKLTKIQCLENLEALDELDFRGCASIERLPDLGNLKTLKKLWLTNCGKLVKIHGLEDLEALDELDLRGCASIERLPDLSNLKKLNKLWLTNCGKLTKIHGLEDLEALDELDLRGCASIKRLPDISNLEKLKKLWLTNCGKLVTVEGLEDLEALDELDLRGCASIERFPDLSNLKKLKKLWLTNCGKLAEIQGLEDLEALEELDITGCTSIERLPDLSNLKKLKKLWLMNCGNLAEIQGLGGLEALEELDIRGCTSIERLPNLLNLKEIKEIMN